MMAAQVRQEPERAEDWGVAEAAAFLGVSKDWVYNKAQDGTLPGAFKIAKRWRFRPAELRAWYAKQGQR
jgi:excisionase family DNA binding protein